MRKLSKILVIVLAMTMLITAFTVVVNATAGDQTENLDPAFPEVVVTPIENPELTFALNFGIKDLEAILADEELLNALFAKYGKMYVDYRLTIEGLSVESVTFNADGTADGYLGGQYDEWSADWVYVPFEDVTVENGGSIMIMELAAKLMGREGLRMTLEEIVTIVANFDCGVYFTDEFLAANPNMKVTLELIVFNENAEGELVDVINVAKNEFTLEAPHEHVFVEGKCECGEVDPNYVPEQPPVEEPTEEPEDDNIFVQIWEFVLSILNWIGDFFKSIFGA